MGSECNIININLYFSVYKSKAHLWSINFVPNEQQNEFLCNFIFVNTQKKCETQIDFPFFYFLILLYNFSSLLNIFFIIQMVGVQNRNLFYEWNQNNIMFW